MGSLARRAGSGPPGTALGVRSAIEAPEQVARPRHDSVAPHGLDTEGHPGFQSVMLTRKLPLEGWRWGPGENRPLSCLSCISISSWMLAFGPFESDGAHVAGLCDPRIGSSRLKVENWLFFARMS